MMGSGGGVLVSFPNTAGHWYRVGATSKSRTAGPALRAHIDLSNTGIAQVQAQDPNPKLVIDMLQARPECPA